MRITAVGQLLVTDGADLMKRQTIKNIIIVERAINPKSRTPLGFRFDNYTIRSWQIVTGGGGKGGQTIA